MLVVRERFEPALPAAIAFLLTTNSLAVGCRSTQGLLTCCDVDTRHRELNTRMAACDASGIVHSSSWEQAQCCRIPLTC